MIYLLKFKCNNCGYRFEQYGEAWSWAPCPECDEIANSYDYEESF